MSAAILSKGKQGAAPAGGGVNLLRLAIELGILAVLGIAVGGAALLRPELAAWFAGTLGFGWAAAGLFGIVTLLLLLHNPLGLLRRARWWLAGAVGVTAVVIGLSLFNGSQGPLYAHGMAGEWGYFITAGNAFAAAVGWVVCAAVAGLLVIPNCARAYYAALRFTARAIWITARAAAKGMGWLALLIAAGASAAGRGTARLSGRILRRAPAPPAAVRKPQPAVAPDAIADEPMPPEPAVAAGILSASGRSNGGWQLPSVEMLAPSEAHQIDENAINAMSDEIKEALAEHGVYVAVEDVKAGPRVVRFGLVPGYMPQRPDKEGSTATQRPSRVRVGDITKRQKDLALALKSPYVRIIETPEPGEGLVGLEVPNPSPGKVLMRSIVEGPDFAKISNKGGLAFALGEDAGGQPLALDLAAMPHLLIAGATGSGKSVCINSLVASLLMTRPPDELRMIMVDPKRVELTPFNGIPHLVTPVIVEPDEVYPALRGLINEMTRRYRAMEDLGVRNIAGYNDKSPEPMPFLVLVVDELADLMMTGGLEVEQQLVRLAQLGRAAGIHMVLATQRPSVKVVTGLLKANVPARVAFAVASQVDSRVILDSAGAEALMGKGDLLLLNNDFPKPRRGQGTLVYDEEIDRIIDYWRNQDGPPLPPVCLDEDSDGPSGDAADGPDSDDAYPGDVMQQARDIALRNPRLNSAMIERRLKVRKSIADEILQDLKDEGLVIDV